MNIYSYISTRFSSALRFAIVGLVTCIAATLVAEILVQALQPETETSDKSDPLVIAMLIDVSGSMEGEPIEEVKQASTQFLQTWDRTAVSIELIPFPLDQGMVFPVLGPGQDAEELITQISRLEAHGSTPTAQALVRAGKSFIELGSSRNAVMLFTDGFPNNGIAARRQAKMLRDRGVVIVGIGTGDSDPVFLRNIVGQDTSKVFSTRLGNFANAFNEAAAVISSSAFGTSSKTQSLVLVATIALFLSAALLVADNIWGLRGNWWRDIWWVPIASMLLGIAGGALGENWFQVRVVTWALVGLACGVSLGLTDIVGTKIISSSNALRLPAKSRRGSVFGLIGGIVGGVIFGLVFRETPVDSSANSLLALASRLAGFSVVGFSIGLAIKIGEELLKDAWLTGITKGSYEGRQFILSKPRIAVGHEGNNDLNLLSENNIGDTAGYFELEGNEWFFRVAPEARNVTVDGAVTQDRIALTDKATLQFGGTEFQFSRRTEPGKAARETNWTLVGDNQSFNIPHLESISFGSDPTCEVVLDSPSIEALHFHLEFNKSGLCICPEPGAPVSINDKVLISGLKPLVAGDLITAGKLELALTANPEQ